MNCDEYLSNLQRKYQRYFDIENNINILDREINLFARYKEINNRTLITSKDIVDSFENNEYCFIKKFSSPTVMETRSFTEFLKSASQEFVKPGRNHMSTYITGIMVVDGEVNSEVKKMVERFKYSKVFALYLKGWCDIRLVLVNPEHGQVITNRAASTVKKVYQIAP